MVDPEQVRKPTCTMRRRRLAQTAVLVSMCYGCISIIAQGNIYQSKLRKKNRFRSMQKVQTEWQNVTGLDPDKLDP